MADDERERLILINRNLQLQRGRTDSAETSPGILSRLGAFAKSLPEIPVGKMVVLGGEEGISFGAPNLNVRPSDAAEGAKSLVGLGDRESTITRRAKELMGLPSTIGKIGSALATEEGRGAIVEGVKKQAGEFLQDPQESIRKSVRSGDAFVDLGLEGLGAAAAAGRGLRPFVKAATAPRRLRKRAREALADASADILGEKTGVKGEAFQIARRSGREGDTGAFLRAQERGESAFEDTAQQILDGVRAVRKEKGDVFRTNKTGLKENPGNPVDRKKVLEGALSDIQEAGLENVTREIKRDTGLLDPRGNKITATEGVERSVGFEGGSSTFRTAPTSERNLISEAMQEMEILQDADTVGEMWAVLQNIKRLERSALGPDGGRAASIITPIRKRLQDQMERKIPGFKAMNAEYAETVGFLEKMETFIRGASKPGQLKFDETTIANLGNVLNDIPRNRFRKAALDELGRRIGVDLEKEIAALVVEQTQPKGLGKISTVTGGGVGAPLGGLLGFSIAGPGGGVVGGGIGAIAGSLLRSQTVSSPRRVANFFMRIGAKERKAKQIEDFVERVKLAALARGMDDTVTIGAALDALARQTGVLGGIGAAQRRGEAQAQVDRSTRTRRPLN